MNPLCCIAPVSVDRDRANPAVVVKSSSSLNEAVGFEEVAVTGRPVSFNSRHSYSTARISSVIGDSDLAADCGGGGGGNGGGENDSIRNSGSVNLREDSAEARAALYSGKLSVAGVLYKWVNFGKGWRARWFVLEDGVLSYYKVHGPDKIVMSPGREKGFKVIGEESWRYMRKASSGVATGCNQYRVNGTSKTWKPFGEVHLKVCS